jgi:LysR family transcriptional regulator, glycine cleavage system transcriptional activator
VLMTHAMRRLPPLAAVRVFEAAARHPSFTAAAAELGMTQAAVSYQIRVLEERVGTPLFRRERRRVLLTDAGRRAAGELTRAFDTIDAAFAALRAEDEAVLTLTATNTFASTWLAWRIGGFQVAHPGLAVRLQTGDALVDFASTEVDAGLRSGTGDWPGLACDRLMAIDYTPMCSPGFLAAHGPALAPADLLRLPRLTPDDLWWRHWLAEAGVGAPPPDGRGIRLDSQAHEGHAAMAGQGVAMLTPALWRNDVAEGRLVRPFAQVSSLGDAYWFVCPEHRRQVPKIRRFREWLLAEVAR